MAKRTKSSLRAYVKRRAKSCCEYCKAPQSHSPDPFSLEHIIPRTKGGEDKLSNLAFSCQGCNNHKHIHTEAPDPLTGKKVPLFHPRKDKWEQHFKWSKAFSHIVGTTSTGRATVRRLELNRKGLLNLRKALFLSGQHPPV